ncbi:hypothetical protein RG47T_1494 [Mucilaginibacter polytrichastri]|uniref:Uncharacterized protein n=1 Tax=Mucilaginibacter polytrichastri TaxID=1302689 RepID=A0A1Q5ZWA0_9SPHI|nr:hypothetical protein RG47T_1494 [Mucilaginibacter polytrichastri]
MKYINNKGVTAFLWINFLEETCRDAQIVFRKLTMYSWFPSLF